MKVIYWKSTKMNYLEDWGAEWTSWKIEYNISYKRRKRKQVQINASLRKVFDDFEEREGYKGLQFFYSKKEKEFKKWDITLQLKKYVI